MVTRARCSRRRGFTLIELLVAMALSVVGLLGLLALQRVAIRGNMMSRNFSEAMGIAQSQLELAQRTPYANVATLAGTVSKLSPTGDSSSPQAIYTRTTTVTTDTTTGTTALTIRVVVSWRDADDPARDAEAKRHSVTVYAERSP
jgi:prepilin-type N-terminal cleavage/methylation domain-containing protein